MGEAGSAVRTLLVLWDIDHTLTENHGVNKEIYAVAFELLTGRRAEHPAQTDGRTEPEIMLNMLLAHGIEPTRAYFERMPDVLEAATVAKAAELRERGHELPGARGALGALGALQATPGIIQSVMSGNIKPNAITKLSVFKLDGYIDFEVGGYGSDDHARDKLVGFARDRASAKYGVQLDRTSTVLIGDTLRDIRAGRNGGARVVGVATGSDSMDALRSEGADIVLPDLRDTEVSYPGADAPSGGIFDTGGEFPNHAIFMVVVPDVAAVCAQVERLGGKVLVPPTTSKDGLVFADLHDPAGNHFGVFTPPPV